MLVGQGVMKVLAKVAPNRSGLGTAVAGLHRDRNAVE
jgi:hypothetical protein